MTKKVSTGYLCRTLVVSQLSGVNQMSGWFWSKSGQMFSCWSVRSGQARIEVNLVQNECQWCRAGPITCRNSRSGGRQGKTNQLCDMWHKLGMWLRDYEIAPFQHQMGQYTHLVLGLEHLRPSSWTWFGNSHAGSLSPSPLMGEDLAAKNCIELLLVLR